MLTNRKEQKSHTPANLQKNYFCRFSSLLFQFHLTFTEKMSDDIKALLKFVKLTENAFDPVRATEKAAGVDLKAAHSVIIKARDKGTVKTDLQIQLPEECYGRIAPRSGLAIGKHIAIAGGVIDQDFRGNVTIILFNLSEDDFKVQKGDRIAQLICEKIYYPTLEECPSLSPTQRNTEGFGSTGTN